MLGPSGLSDYCTDDPFGGRRSAVEITLQHIGLTLWLKRRSIKTCYFLSEDGFHIRNSRHARYGSG